MFANVPCALPDRYIRTSANIAGRGRNGGWFGYRFGYGFALPPRRSTGSTRTHKTAAGPRTRTTPTSLEARPLPPPNKCDPSSAQR
jgi:hypothetical protein